MWTSLMIPVWENRSLLRRSKCVTGLRSSLIAFFQKVYHY